MRVELYEDSFRLPPFRHQREDVQRLLDNPCFGLFHEMGLGKSKIVIDTADILYRSQEIDLMLVVTPASVRSVWADPDPVLGEIAKHDWTDPLVMEFHARGLRINRQGSGLPWIVTNYEFLRSGMNLEKLNHYLDGRRTALVLDESSYIKNHRAQQTKAVLELAPLMRRRYILNGTPIANNPLDLWSQIRFLSPRFLPFKNFFAFRARYCIMGGWRGKQIVQWVNLDELQQKIAPYVLRREKKDCLDLPAKTYTQVEVPLSVESWARYKQMREEAIVWLDQNPSLASQAGVKMMRLAQLTSGILGGIVLDDDTVDPYARVVSCEKIEWLRGWLADRLAENPDFKVIVWCRFRRELEGVSDDPKIRSLIPTYRLYGNQSKAERSEAIDRFSRERDKPGLLAANTKAGGLGLNLVACSNVVYLSNDFSLMTRLQSEDRTHRPGQDRNVLYQDVVATGPKGQRTVDHAVLKALREKQDIASWTVAAWKQALEV